MTVRFRIRTPAGQELSFTSREIFEDFVRSGDLSPDDLVYDVDTGSWSPARTHPLVLEIEYAAEAEAGTGDAGAAAQSSGDDAEGSFGLSLAPEQPREDEDEEAEGTESDSDRARATEDADSGSGDLGLALAPEEAVDADEATRAFVEKMEAEREQSLDFGSRGAGIQGFTMEDTGSLADMLEPETVAPSPESVAPSPESVAPTPAPPPPARPTPSRTEREEPSEPRGPRREPSATPTGGGFIAKMAAAVVVLVLLGGGGYLGIRLASSSPADLIRNGESPGVEEPTPEPPGPQPEIASTETAVRERALERYLTSTENTLRDLPALSDAWLTGEYLAEPSSHPDVPTTWEAYRSAMAQVRSGDRERYRSAYEAALDDALIEGEDRTARLEAALRDFEARAPEREAHFDRVQALASAAIQSHTALLEAEGLILFDAAGGPGRNGLGVGAYGRDADSQRLLDEVLDLLTDRLSADGRGPGAPDRVREWLWTGFLDAATS